MVNPRYLAPEADAFCAVVSRERGEPLYGTALHNDVWFLLEYNGPWTEKATTDNELSPEVRAWLGAQAASVGRARLQFIKYERESSGDTVAFFVAITSEKSPRLYRFQLAGYEALLDIDIAALLAGEAQQDAALTGEPLLLVCTNGRRDRCCALFGLEVYYALRALEGDAVWQTTHVGGHRFAANVITFPHGLYYGRLQNAADAVAFHQAYAAGEMPLPYLRGRSCYEEGVQAAEYFLRQQTGERRLQAFTLDQAAWAEEVLAARFVHRESGQRYLLRLAQQPLDFPRYKGCGKPGEGLCTGFRLLSLAEK